MPELEDRNQGPHLGRKSDPKGPALCGVPKSTYARTITRDEFARRVSLVWEKPVVNDEVTPPEVCEACVEKLISMILKGMDGGPQTSP